MKINVINRVDIEYFENAILRAGNIDYIVMNSQTKLEITCSSNGQAVTYSVGKDKKYTKYKNYTIAIDESMGEGEVKFVREV